jgi:hypothetical protein
VMDQRDNKQAQNLSQADQNKDNGNAKSKKWEKIFKKSCFFFLIYTLLNKF